MQKEERTKPLGCDERVSVDAKCPALFPKHCGREGRREEIFISARAAHRNMEMW